MATRDVLAPDPSVDAPSAGRSLEEPLLTPLSGPGAVVGLARSAHLPAAVARPELVLGLQRALGNRATARLLEGQPALLPRHRMPGHRMPGPDLQRMIREDDDESPVPPQTAELNTFMQKLKNLAKDFTKPWTKTLSSEWHKYRYLNKKVTPQSQVDLQWVRDFIAGVDTDKRVKEEHITAAWAATIETEQRKQQIKPRNLAAEYRQAEEEFRKEEGKPPKVPGGLEKAAAAAFETFLRSRSTTRQRLGVTEENAPRVFVVFVDAGDNAKKLAAYLGLKPENVVKIDQTQRFAEATNVILYGHTAFFAPEGGPPLHTHPLFGQKANLTAKDVANALPRNLQQLSIIGCDSEPFKQKLAAFLPSIPISFTDFPFEWRKAGPLEYILAEKKGRDHEIRGTLIDILLTETIDIPQP